MKFLFWGVIVCSLLGLFCSAASLILRQAFVPDSATVITTAISTINVAVNAAVLTGTLMSWRKINELQ